MGTYGITEEDRRLEKMAKTILLDLLKWLESCYEVKNVVAAETVWRMIVSILKEMIDFTEGDFGSGWKHDLFNSLIELHRSFFKKEIFIPSLDLECRWLQEFVTVGGGEEYTYDKYIYQHAWELLKPVHKEVLSSIEDGLLKELERKSGYEDFFESVTKVYFMRGKLPNRAVKNPRSFFLLLKKDLVSKYGPRCMRNNLKKVRSFIRKGLEFYPVQKKI